MKLRAMPEASMRIKFLPILSILINADHFLRSTVVAAIQAVVKYALYRNILVVDDHRLSSGFEIAFNDFYHLTGQVK